MSPPPFLPLHYRVHLVIATPLCRQYRDTHSSPAAVVSVLGKAGFIQHSGLLPDGNGSEIRATYSSRPSPKSLLPPCVTAVAMGQSNGRSCRVFPHSRAQCCQAAARKTVSEPLDALKPLLKILCLSEGRLSHEPAAPCFLSSSLVLSSPLPPHKTMPTLFGVTAFPWPSPAWKCSPSASYFFKNNQFCILTSRNPLGLSLP